MPKLCWESENQKGLELAEDYRRAVVQHGLQSYQADDAFSAIFNRYYPRLLGRAVKSGLTQEVAEEITQQTLLKLWKCLNSTTEITDLDKLLSVFQAWCRDSWLATRYTHKGKSIQTNVSLDMSDLLTPCSTHSNNPEVKVLLKETSEQISQLIRAMHPNHRTALLAQVFEGKSLKEMTVQHGWSINQAKKYTSLGRKWLGRKYAELERQEQFQAA